MAIIRPRLVGLIILKRFDLKIDLKKSFFVWSTRAFWKPCSTVTSKKFYPGIPTHYRSFLSFWNWNFSWVWHKGDTGQNTNCSQKCCTLRLIVSKIIPHKPYWNFQHFDRSKSDKISWNQIDDLRNLLIKLF